HYLGSAEQASSALENNVATIRLRRFFKQRSASCLHLCLAVAERHSPDAFLTFDSVVSNLLETNTILAKKLMIDLGLFV
ncbi:MAG: hypothetical protein II555_01570, partial [Bacteroidales bacterium]|nr:hypothetical protein [Bacteroidales bacterium]